ncbi:hypothetical protein BDZ97DRAFT_543494 [Flammula alnicola]|nr:hypothetical protein BDZ97DRAFT_543494 [Flammula alnicola]
MDRLVLPAELVRLIVQQIKDGHTLAMLSSSCKALRSEAEISLYRFCAERNPIRHIKFLTTITNNPRLAALVQIYRGRSAPVGGRQQDVLWTLVGKALPNMINLKQLSILGYKKDLAAIPMEGLTFKLEILSWIPVDIGDSRFQEWLETQQSLKHLRWICRTRTEVSPNACPNLSSLEGNWHVVKALLPGRTIDRLDWLMDQGCPPVGALDQLSEELQQLRSLSFEHNFNSPEYSSLGKHLQSLRFLELCDHHSDWWSPSPHPNPQGHSVIISTNRGTRRHHAKAVCEGSVPRTSGYCA